MRVLVTGASGFIGQHVVQRLLARGHQVVATTRGDNYMEDQNGVIVIRNLDLGIHNLASILENCNAVVHCAARAAPWGRRRQFLQDNVVATQRLIDAARDAGSVRRFIFLSTPSIYFRFADQENIGEEFSPPTNWVTHYAETKWLAECIALKARELGPIALRPRAVFGTGDRAIVPRLLAVARSGYFPLPNQGKARIDVTCVDNVVDAVELALSASVSAEGYAYNISNGTPVVVRDLLERLFEILGCNVQFIPFSRSVGLGIAAVIESVAGMLPGNPEPRITRYGIGLLGFSQTLDISKAQRELGYAARVSIDDGLEYYARWWKSQ
ncbi:MAG TPA: NAD(P)-dependent oxidoreductase [Steroidobacteraceae bacterium]|nr:NAD(P)-dependent oxidoreductase [Steroidobacteraceae bacterium]